MIKSLRILLRNKMQFALFFLMLFSLLLNVYLVYSDFYHAGSSEVAEYEDEYEPENYADADEDVHFITPFTQESAKIKEILPQKTTENKAPQIKTLVINKVNTFEKLLIKQGADKNHVNQVISAIRKVYDKPFANGDEIGIVSAQMVKNQKGARYFIEKLVLTTATAKIELNFSKEKGSFEAKQNKFPVQTKIKLVQSKINGSIFASAKKAGADPRVVNELVDIYSHSLDFQRDVKAGDKFKILYEQQFNSAGKAVSKPSILYASITSRGEEKELFQYVHSSGKVDYFNSKGEGAKRALLKTPINGARMTSGFGFRKHPVLGYSRMHKGLDYAAPVGTPVLAAGDGVIHAVKNQPNGYGRHVQIRHNGTYSTLYAHLNRFAANLKPGSRVSQGQVIGYVGTSGMSTGPHLHYEVIQAGKKVNPSKVNFPRATPLRGKDLQKLQNHINGIGVKIAQLEKGQNSKIMQAEANKE